MKLQLIRNATLKLSYGGKTILIDPDFAPKHSRPSFTGRSPNPLVELPLQIPEILESVELVLISHLHADHYDTVAQQLVPKHLPILCQPGNDATIRSHGFQDVTPLIEAIDIDGVSIAPCQGSHGLGPVVEKMGSVIGFLLQAQGEPTIYWCGDTVLYPPVLGTIARHRPDIIITHSCGALWGSDLIVMDTAETVAVCQALPSATLIATHMETLDHATVDRKALRQAADAAGIPTEHLLIPGDGEVVEF